MASMQCYRAEKSEFFQKAPDMAGWAVKSREANRHHGGHQGYAVAAHSETKVSQAQHTTHGVAKTQSHHGETQAQYPTNKLTGAHPTHHHLNHPKHHSGHGTGRVHFTGKTNGHHVAATGAVGGRRRDRIKVLLRRFKDRFSYDSNCSCSSESDSDEDHYRRRKN